MATRVIKIITKTANSRTSHTRIFIHSEIMVVIVRRILAKPEDIASGWFDDYNLVIRKTQNYILVENQMVFWTTSFDAIIEAYNDLTKH